MSAVRQGLVRHGDAGIGLRIESLAEMVKRHAELCGRAWMDVRITAERMTKGGAL